MVADTFPVHPWAAEASPGVRFGVETLAMPDWGATRAFVQAIEGYGFDSLWIPDHPMVTGSATWTHLAAFATVTERIRLGPLVACAAYANPVVIARAIADIDLLSGGRALLGLGSGDMPHEFAQMGIPWLGGSQRQAALEEALRIIHPLLHGEPVTSEGEHHSAADAVLVPPPAQPWVPILVAGGGEKTTLRFAAHYADASNIGPVSWAGGAFTPDDARRKFVALDGHLANAGRPAEAVLRSGLLAAFISEDSVAAQAKFDGLPPFLLAFFEQLPVVGTPDDAVQRVQTMIEAGFRYVIFIVMPGDEETVRLLAEHVLPVATAAGRETMGANVTT
ncbi:MAG: LLM class flavin-dependent oxidoreductase [Chloroflexota bacterium]|nr:LLM class flavin-dependent oxidoreductase [Chloroflexota bacterium]